MEKLAMCRICLVENVRMYVVVNRSLHELYEKLTDIPFVTEDSRPIFACFICCTKLKQCYRLLRKCLEAEKQFARMMNEDYERKHLINQDCLEFYSGFIKSPIECISIIDECQTESITIKEELPAVCEGLDDIIEPKEEHQSAELESENVDYSCLYDSDDRADISPQHSESDLEDDVPLMEFKIEVEEEEVSEKKGRVWETKKPEPENFNNSCLDVADLPPHYSESDFGYDVPLIEFKTGVEEEVSNKKQRVRVMKRLDDVIEAKEEHQSNELESKKNNNSSLNVADIPPQHSESDLRYDVPLIEIKTEVEEVSLNNSCLNIADIPPQHSESDLRYDVPLIEIKTEVEEVSLNNSCLNVADIPPQHSESDLRYDIPLIEIKTEVEGVSLNNSCLNVADIPPQHSESDLRYDVPLIEIKTEVEEVSLNNSCLNVADIPPQHSDLRYDVPLIEFKTEVEEEESKMKRRARKMKKLEPENVDYSCLDVADLPPPYSESDLEDDVPLMEFKIEVEEEELSKKKQRAGETMRATVAKKSKLEDALIGEQTQKEKSDSKVIRTTQNCTSKPGTYFKEPYKCEQRSFHRVTNMIQHPRTKIGENDVCQRSFSHKSNFTEHIRIHSGEKSYKCVVCQRSFNQKIHLTNHIRKHTGEKPYRCDICERSFSEKGVLTKHIRIHTGEKPYKCDVCQRTFSQKGGLTKHIRIHTGEKPYKCYACHRSFSHKSNLTQHIRIHTSEKPYKCDLCQRSFNQSSNLINHIRKHTGEKPYKCGICERSFSEKGILTKHFNRMHTVEKNC